MRPREAPRGVTRGAVTLAALIGTVAAAAAGAQNARAASARSFAITHVTVIDGADSTPRLDQTVIVRGTRIISVSPAASAPPSNARSVDGRGKFLIPGLWDMHVHTSIPGGRALLGLF